jgi:hypothetical protein
VAARLTESLASWGCWDESWAAPTSGGITQARQRLGPEPLELLFGKVAVPVAGALTRGAFLRHWRLMAIDGFERPRTPLTATRSSSGPLSYSGSRSAPAHWPARTTPRCAGCATFSNPAATTFPDPAHGPRHSKRSQPGTPERTGP